MDACKPSGRAVLTRRGLLLLASTSSPVWGADAVWAVAAAANTAVYRCGNRYSDSPCPGGQAVDAADPRSPEQVRQAAEVLRREQALAKRQQAERDRTERNRAIQTQPITGQAPAVNGKTRTEPKPKDRGHRPEQANQPKRAAADEPGRRQRPSPTGSGPTQMPTSPAPSAASRAVVNKP